MNNEQPEQPKSFGRGYYHSLLNKNIDQASITVVGRACGKEYMRAFHACIESIEPCAFPIVDAVDSSAVPDEYDVYTNYTLRQIKQEPTNKGSK